MWVVIDSEAGVPQVVLTTDDVLAAVQHVHDRIVVGPECYVTEPAWAAFFNYVDNGDDVCLATGETSSLTVCNLDGERRYPVSVYVDDDGHLCCE